MATLFNLGNTIDDAIHHWLKKKIYDQTASQKRHQFSMGVAKKIY